MYYLKIKRQLSYWVKLFTIYIIYKGFSYKIHTIILQANKTKSKTKAQINLLSNGVIHKTANPSGQ